MKKKSSIPSKLVNCSSNFKNKEMDKMPNPSAGDMSDPVWEAIWQAIKKWDVNVPKYYIGYCGATGSHATIIYKAVMKALYKK